MKLGLLVMAGLFGITLVSLVATPRVAAWREREAVGRVFEQRLKARRTALTTEHDPSGAKYGFSKKILLPALQQIDTSGCPARFRLAWDLYIKAWEQQGSVVSSKVRHNVAALEAAAATSNPIPLLTLEPVQADDVTSGPFLDCQQIAAKLGYYRKDASIEELMRIHK
jgi:hypothetical protein